MQSRPASLLALLLLAPVHAEELTPVTGVEWQPLRAQVQRLQQALIRLGSPLDAQSAGGLEALFREADPESAAERLQRLLDPHVLFRVHINPEMRVRVNPGPAPAELAQNGWRVFLVKVENEAGTTAPLQAVSPQAAPLAGSPQTAVADRWLDLKLFDEQPLQKRLGGLPLEYRIIQLYSRDAGKREAKFSFHVGQGTQDLGFRNETDLLFTCAPAREIRLRVRDEQGKPTTGMLVIRDAQQRIYPSLSKRLAPDFAFHPQIYRADGESIQLPDGTYAIEFARGPESIPEHRTVVVGPRTQQLEFRVARWIDPSRWGWWSGDHHIHAAGCKHYDKPSEGVHAPDMMRHILGEDLKVGCNLTWGPCFDYQKQFFTGSDDKVSQYPYLLRYDVEVSGFGSHKSGHLCLLRLKEQIYPGGNSMDHWPTLGLNTLRWAKKQGAVCGPAHSGWGLAVKTHELPNYEIPPFDGIGANEYIMNVTHEVPGPDGKLVPAVDFISTVDTPYVWELNIWYHTLNCGFRTRISGETDFPCIYGERVGLGRSYVKLDGRLTYDAWCEGIRQGRNYVSDGRSHLLDFRVNRVRMGEEGSELKLARPGTVRVSARVAARLNETPNPSIQQRPYAEQPYWDIERARLGSSREVPVEVVVNGYPVARRQIVANGSLQTLEWEIPLERSSWIALRILPSSHTNPVFVEIGGKPIRASRRSAQWCLEGVQQCWRQKQPHIAPPELAQAREAYQHAEAVYRKILSESEVE